MNTPTCKLVLRPRTPVSRARSQHAVLDTGQVHAAAVRLLMFTLCNLGVTTLIGRILADWRRNRLRLALAICRGEALADAAIEIAEMQGLSHSAGARLIQSILHRPRYRRIIRLLHSWVASACCGIYGTGGQVVTAVTAQLDAAEERADGLAFYGAGLEQCILQRGAAQMVHCAMRLQQQHCQEALTQWHTATLLHSQAIVWNQAVGSFCGRAGAAAVATIFNRRLYALTTLTVASWHRNTSRSFRLLGVAAVLAAVGRHQCSCQLGCVVRQWLSNRSDANSRLQTADILQDRLQSFDFSAAEMARHVLAEELLQRQLSKHQSCMVRCGLRQLQTVLDSTRSLVIRRVLAAWLSSAHLHRRVVATSVGRVVCMCAAAQRCRVQQLRAISCWGHALRACERQLTRLARLLSSMQYAGERHSARTAVHSWRGSLEQYYEGVQQAEMSSAVTLLWKQEMSAAVGLLEQMLVGWMRRLTVAAVGSWAHNLQLGRLLTQMGDAEDEMMRQQLKDQLQLDEFMLEAAARAVGAHLTHLQLLKIHRAVGYWAAQCKAAQDRATSEAAWASSNLSQKKTRWRQQLQQLTRWLNNPVAPQAMLSLSRWRLKSCIGINSVRLDATNMGAGGRVLWRWGVTRVDLQLLRHVHSWQLMKRVDSCRASLLKLLLIAYSQKETRWVESVLLQWQNNHNEDKLVWLLASLESDSSMSRVRGGLQILSSTDAQMELSALRCVFSSWRRRFGCWMDDVAAVQTLQMVVHHSTMRAAACAVHLWSRQAARCGVSTMLIRVHAGYIMLKQLRHLVSVWSRSTRLHEQHTESLIMAAHSTADRVQAELEVERRLKLKLSSVLLRVLVLHLGASRSWVMKLKQRVSTARATIRLIVTVESRLTHSGLQWAVDRWLGWQQQQLQTVRGVRILAMNQCSNAKQRARSMLHQWRRNRQLAYIESVKIAASCATVRAMHGWATTAVRRSVDLWAHKVWKNHVWTKLEAKLADAARERHEWSLKLTQLALVPRSHSKCRSALKRWNHNTARACVLSQLHYALTEHADAASVGQAIAVQASLHTRSGLISLADVLAATNGAHSHKWNPQPQIVHDDQTSTQQLSSVAPYSHSDDNPHMEDSLATLGTLRDWAASSEGVAANPYSRPPVNQAADVRQNVISKSSLTGKVLQEKLPLNPSASGAIPQPNFEQLCQWANGQV